MVSLKSRLALKASSLFISIYELAFNRWTENTRSAGQPPDLPDFDHFQADLPDTIKSARHPTDLPDFAEFSGRFGGCPADLPDF